LKARLQPGWRLSDGERATLAEIGRRLGRKGLQPSSDTSAEIAVQRQSDPARLRRLLHRELDWIAMRALEKDRTP
jgi:hypothetical protein